VSTVPVSYVTPPVLPPRRWARNGVYPSAWLARALAARANQLIIARGKEIFRHSSGIANVPSASPGSTRVRWRGAFHTSTRVSQLWAYIGSMPDDKTGSPSVTVEAFNSSSVSMGVATLAGMLTGDSSTTPAHCTSQIFPLVTSTGAIATTTADDEGTLVVSDLDGGRAMGVSVWEVPLLPDTSNGYIDPSFGAQSPIYQSFRQGLASIANSQWKAGSRHLPSFCVELDSAPRTIAVNTATNLIDGTTTGAPTAATPGLYMDLTNCARSKDVASGAMVYMRVYAKCTSAGNGTVQLVDSGGTVHHSTSGFGTSAAWSAASNLFLSASGGKYDLQFKTAAGTLSVYAVSLYLHE
jgi:hypothetical protein